jgi:hypothetical protein
VINIEKEVSVRLNREYLDNCLIRDEGGGIDYE